MSHMKNKWKTWSLLQLENSSILVTISLTSKMLCPPLPPSATNIEMVGFRSSSFAAADDELSTTCGSH